MLVADLPIPQALIRLERNHMTSNTIYQSTKTMPYVYQCTNPSTGEYYIGYRRGNKVPSTQDIGTHYFTSSRVVKPNFDKFNVTIVAEFFDHYEAYWFEQQLIAENFKDPLILNRKYQRRNDDKAIFTNKGHTEATKQKLRDKRANQVMNRESRIKAAAKLKGKKRAPFTAEHLANMSKAHKTPEYLAMMAQRRRDPSNGQLTAQP